MRKTIILLVLAVAFQMIILDSTLGVAADGDVGQKCTGTGGATPFNTCAAGHTCAPEIADTFTNAASTICRCAANYFWKATTDSACTACGAGGTRTASGTFLAADSNGCACAFGSFSATLGCWCGSAATQNTTNGSCTAFANATCPTSAACTCNASFTLSTGGAACDAAAVASSSTTTSSTEGDDEEGDDESASFAMQPIIAALLVAAVALFA